jgi:hypothetical protein
MNAIESPESSSPIVTRAVAAGLRGEYCNNYKFPAWQRALLQFIGTLPQGVARFAISRFQSISALPPDSLDDFSLNDLLLARIYDYTQLTGLFPAVTVGAALGGATAYLSLALGGPFLPQTFVVTLKGGSPDGDVNVYLHRSLDRALKIANDHPGLMTIQHYDPVHDGWLTRLVNHLRFKLLDLPPVYAYFIRQRLEPGGAVVYFDGGASWLRYRLGPRSVLQVGGWGDISAEEFLEGSERIRKYTKQNKMKENWRLDGYPLERGPESEWGCEPGLDAALERFCKVEGYRFVRIPLPHPDDFSRLAYAAAKHLLEKEAREPAGVLVEMFSQFDATAALQAGLLPLWLIFNTHDSARYLKEMAAHFPADGPIFFSPLVTFSSTPDIASWEEWEEALGAREWINIGTRRSHYPTDARALVRWVEPLREWVERNRNPVTARLEAEELLALSKGRI